ncbi:hypothetical protein [Streptomyces sp. NK15101]|uniref:hypothetical protein n=1 Tax=Streptomyces sp. NK15101 TaxID=2873261 RepID=UPI001CEC407E|nr:hypothetical protein [Streptomyces sp. NK15101]
MDPRRRRLARAATGYGNAEAGLRVEYERYAADPARRDHDPDLPTAAAVVAVHVPSDLFSVAWSGDAHAYLFLDGLGLLRPLTEDHNARRRRGNTAWTVLTTSCTVSDGTSSSGSSIMAA